MKPKALIILNRLVIGGQAIDTLPLLYHLKNNFELKILYGCKDVDEQEATTILKKFGNMQLALMPTFKRNLNIFKDIKAYFFILKAIKQFKPDIVHTHGLKSGLLGRTAAYFTRTKCIIHTYHGHHFHSYFGSVISTGIIFMERLLARISTKIVAISPQQKEEIVDRYKIVPLKKIEVIPLGVDQSLFASTDEAARQCFKNQYNISGNTVAVGIIGRIVPIKNFSLFVRVVATVKQKNKTVKFFIIGDGNDRARTQQEIDGLNLTWCNHDNLNNDADIIFTSWVQDISGTLQGLDVVVLTSHNEGTPLSLIEAQFCGKPVVATNVGGVKDTFMDGESGFLVPPGNVDIFAEKLLLLVNNDDLRKEMGNKAVEFATKNFSKAKEIDSFKQLYNSCAK